jgi:hypothetical protein
MNTETVRQILTTNLNTRKSMAEVVPNNLHVFRRKTVATLEHAPYSPYLALWDFFLFPELKCSVKGTHFQSIEGRGT